MAKDKDPGNPFQLDSGFFSIMKKAMEGVRFTRPQVMTIISISASSILATTYIIRVGHPVYSFVLVLVVMATFFVQRYLFRSG